MSTPAPEITQTPTSEDDFELHDNIPFGRIPVVALAQPEVRRTLALWYEPDARSTGEPELQEVDEEGWIVVHPGCPSDALDLRKLLYEVAPRGFCDAYGLDAPPVPIEVRVEIGAYLEHTWSVTAMIDARELGIVFAIAHDMYRHVYAMDDRVWKEQGREPAPRVSKTVVNRAPGKYVWGHDIGDLVFEQLYFRQADGVEPFKRDRVYTDPTFIGTVGFGIGS
jgi:hypothetical protein